MKTPQETQAKREALNEQHLLYRNADSVTDELFRSLDFFDSYDLIQVKYEMVRRVQKEGWSVTRAADAFGFSRISYYAIQRAFDSKGIIGLMPKKRGPKQPTKLTDTVMAFIESQREQVPVPSAGKLQTLVAEHLGVTVHKRTIERALQVKKKYLAPGASKKASGFEHAYEVLRMKALQSPDLIHSRSQLIFMSMGMSRWLQAASNISVAPEHAPQLVGRISIPSDVEQNALWLLTDMALHTWKEAG